MSRRHSLVRLPIILLASAAAGCAEESRTALRDSAVATAPRPEPVSPGETAATSVPEAATARPQPPARDADQRFLRRMLDHHEAIITVVHEAMMEPAGHAAHGSVADPAATDSYLDAEKQEMLRLLESLYDEQYSPRPTPGLTRSGTDASAHADDRAADSAMAGGEDSEQSELAAAYRAGVALIDQTEHQLRRPEVRALAARLRQTQTARLREVMSVPPSQPRSTDGP